MSPLAIGPLAIDPPILQAPMAGFTNFAFRAILRQLVGVGLPATEMLSARGLLADAEPGESDRLWGVQSEPRPLAVQIWDNDPLRLATAARRLVDTLAPSLIDINFGCPVRDVSEKAESGSYLLRFPDRVGQIVQRVVAACGPTPVTAKIRLGCTRDTINAVEVAQAVEAAGGAAITIHGRTAADGFGGKADWPEIARVKPHLARMPVIGNGDLSTAEQIVAALHNYGLDGVMVGRAALGRPWLFHQAAELLAGRPAVAEPSLVQQRAVLLEHYRLLTEQFGPQKATVLMRKYACCYAQGRAGARAFRAQVAQAATAEEFLRLVDAYFASGG